MKAIVVHNPGDWKVENVPVPTIPDNWALIRVSMAAFCATDIEVLKGKIKANYPIIPGHEWCGVVEQVNGGDKKWVGRRVVGSNDVCCLTCRACRSGMWRNCSEFGEIGFAYNGAFAEYMVVPQYALYELPDEISNEQAALLEPAGVAFGTLEKVNAKLGDSLLIIGAGPIGLNMLSMSKAAGMINITVIDKNENRLNLASKMGADHTLRFSDECDIRSRIGELYPEGPDAVIDCTGSEQCVKLALDVAPKMGRVGFAGYGKGRDMKVHYDDIHIKDLRVAGTGNNWNVLEKTMRLAQYGKLNTTCMITHRFNLNDYDEAVKLAETYENGYVKAVFTL